MAIMADRLTPRQQRAIAALLTAKDIKTAAEAAGIGHRTLTRWMADPKFRAALAQAESDLLDKAGRDMLAGFDRMINELYTIATQAVKPSDRRAAIRDWLEYGLKIRDQGKTEERLAEIEKALFGEVKE